MERRTFVKLGAMMGAGAILPMGFADKVFGFTLAGQAMPASPLLVTKYVDPLPVNELGVMPSTGSGGGGEVLYDVGLYQFSSQVHSQIAPTTTWGYRPQGWTPGVSPESTYLGPTFVVPRGQKTEVTWNNNLQGVAHPLPVDPSLHWAAPEDGGTVTLADGTVMPMKNTQPGPYTDPVTGMPTWINPATGLVDADITLHQVPMVPHVHGGEQAPGVDGGPDAWWTPGFESTGHAYMHAGKFDMDSSEPGKGGNVYPYDNTQPGATIWYHDHALGITRLNVYMGTAGAYVIYDQALESELIGKGIPSVFEGATDSFGHAYDIPLVIQDRMFDTAGQLYFPAVSVNPDVNPLWVPEFFGDHMLVNGKVWPVLDVEPRAYRFRVLNGSNARGYELFLWNQGGNGPGPVLSQIATDGGYLGKAAAYSMALGQRLITLPGERHEIVVDFRGYAGQTLTLRNSGRSPYPKGAPVNPNTTGQVMQFRVAAAPVAVNGWTPPAVINPDLTTYPSISVASDPIVKVRSMTLNEYMGPGGPLMATLNNTKWPHGGHSDETEFPKLGTTEVWEIINTTGDAHPIHTHLTQFQLISRQRFSSKFIRAYVAAFGGMDPGMMEPMGPPYVYDPQNGQFVPNPMYAMMPGYVAPRPVPAYRRDLRLTAAGALITVPAGSVVGGNPDVAPFLQGPVQYAPPQEQGWKDTVQMYPGEVTRILVRFKPIDGSAEYPFDATSEPGYVWHCHILDHEDNEMMRPYHVVP